MPILADNIKIRAASTNDDTMLNGGPPSSVVIADGVSNSIFPDISEFDRSAGSVLFRKIYPGVDTLSQDVLYGANIIVSEPPADPAVSVVVFPSASVGETQGDVIERLGGIAGALSTSQLDEINTGAYLEKFILPGGTYWWQSNLSDWTDKDAGYFLKPNAGSNGAFHFRLTDTMEGVALTRIVVGQSMALVDFYQGKVVQVQTFTVSKVLICNVANMLALEFAEPSAYESWGEAVQNFPTAGANANGTYFIEQSLVGVLGRAEYYGSARLSASASPASRTISVDTLTAAVVPSALTTIDSADLVLGFRPGLLTKSLDGREPIFEAGRFAVVGKNVQITVTGTGSYSVGETLVKRVKVLDAAGNRITTGWTANLDTGEVTVSSVAGWGLPAKIVARIEDMAMVSSVNTGAGTITLGKDLIHSYPAGSSVSAALVLGNASAKISVFFDQQSWTNEWSDELIGNAVSGAEFNRAGYPIVMTNAGAITERWRIQFTSPSAYTVTGESVGQIATGTTGADCAPVNPATGQPYFTIPAGGWGLGWSAGNVIRMNTIGAAPPCWLIRCVQQSAETLDPSTFEIALRGGVNRP